MKNLILICLIIFFSCKGAIKDKESSVIQPDTLSNSINSIRFSDALEMIDTMEFITYWNQFRKAILINDTITLATMLNDSIIDGWFLLRDYTRHTDKLSKSVFLKHLYVLFTPSFLSLLKSYDIRKDLFSQKGDNQQEQYHCTMKISDISAGVVFYSGQTTDGIYRHNTVNYYMRKDNKPILFENYKYNDGYDIFVEKDIGQVDNIIFFLGFIQTSQGIKLDNIGFFYNLTVTG